jgi:histidinol-phosphatase
MNEFLTAAIFAAQKADAITMKYYRDGAAVQIKPDQTPVTVADQEAEKAIIAAIASAFPDHGFLGEESGATHDERDYLWIIDPIDGTKNFIRGIPIWGTQIALMHRGKLIVGVSSMPALDELLYADEKAAFLNGKPIRVSDLADISRSSVSFAGLNRMPAYVMPESLFQLFRTFDRIRAYGDCYPFHLLASGRLEAVIQSFIHIWDIAAIVRIIESAGGRCTDFAGKPIGIASTDLLATNSKLHEELLNFVRP